MKIEIDNVEEVVDGKVDSYKTSTRIAIPKKYANRKVKIIILKEEGKNKK
jgi:putative transposon-encoded protein